MKWFKHDCNTHNDEKIQMLMDEFGISAYGFYLILLELVSEKINKDNFKPEIQITLKLLKRKTHIYHDNVLVKLLRSMHHLGLISLQSPDDLDTISNNVFLISVPNLLKRLDNWTTNSQVTNKQPPTQQEQEVRSKKKEEEKEPEGFLKVWSLYPKRIGKKEAIKHFKVSIKTSEDLTSINLALKNYLASSVVAKGFVQNGSTWFNNWRDWIDAPPDLIPKIYGYTKDKKPVTDLEIAKIMGMAQ